MRMQAWQGCCKTRNDLEQKKSGNQQQKTTSMDETLTVFMLVGRAALGFSREMFVENSVLGVVLEGSVLES